MSPPTSTFTLLLLLIFTFIRCVYSHGFLCYPPTRGSFKVYSMYQSKPKNPLLRKYPLGDSKFADADVPRNGCPHCKNAGGVGTTKSAMNGKWRPYEPLNPDIEFRTDHGMCGDPVTMKTPRDYERGGKFGYPKSPIVANYKPGATIEFVVDITTNHQGYFEYFICDVTECDDEISPDCFKNGHCHQLEREKSPACESRQSMECGPVHDDYPGRWPLICRQGEEHTGEQFMGGPYMRYKLPKGFKSDHAVIQFYWIAANTCNPPGFVDYFVKFPMRAWKGCGGDGGTVGGRGINKAECGGATFPEEYWGCADVSVGGKGPFTVAGPDAPVPPKSQHVKLDPLGSGWKDLTSGNLEAYRKKHEISDDSMQFEGQKETKESNQEKKEMKEAEHTPEPNKKDDKKSDDSHEPEVHPTKDDVKEEKSLETRKAVKEPTTTPQPKSSSSLRHKKPKCILMTAEMKKSIADRKKAKAIREKSKTAEWNKTLEDRKTTEKKRRETEKVRNPRKTQEYQKTMSDREKTEAKRKRTEQRRTNNAKFKCAKSWTQCGGVHYDGPKLCCESGFTCQELNGHYAQCMRT